MANTIYGRVYNTLIDLYGCKEEQAKEILLEKEIEIVVSLGDGNKTAQAYGCDLTYDYVKINGDYRT